jgi:hypothetical protein
MSHKEKRMCCPKHAPLYKIKRSSNMMMMFLFVNFAILGLQASLFYCFYQELSKHWKEESLYHEKIWIIMIILAAFFFLLSNLLFFVTYCRDPGYTKSIELTEFNEHLNQALVEDRNLDYFCFFCRCIWSQSSVHCMTCMRCVEGFDHHCSIINNCIGYKNHASFIIFLIITLFYSLA